MDIPRGWHGSPRPLRAAAGSRTRRQYALLGCLLVLLIAGFNCFYRLGEPAHPIWDESYYLTSTARYETGSAQFASHPPLGLMLIAAGDHISGLNREIDWRPIASVKKIKGDRVPGSFFFLGVRCASALFGTMAAGLFFVLLLTLELGTSRALLLTTPFLFDTALIAQFRAAQLDSFQLFFMLAALVALVRAIKGNRPTWFLAFGCACGLATMVRANAILLAPGILWPLASGLRDIRRVPITTLLCVAAKALIALFGFGIAAAATLSIHVAIAHNPLPAGSAAAVADAPFVEPRYAAYVAGKAPLTPGAIVSAADGYRRFMAADLAGIGIGDPNGSSPWGWPLGRGSIVYRWDSDGGSTSFVALIPNFAAWLVSLLGLSGTVAMAALDVARYRRRSAGRHLYVASLLLVLWFVLMAADVVLASHRVMYLYHYFMPLTLGWVMAAVLARRLATSSWSDLTDRFVVSAAGLILVNFLLLSPLALHRPLGMNGCSARSWGSGLRCDTAQAGAPVPAPRQVQIRAGSEKETKS